VVVVTGVTPVNFDLVERVRRSSSTSAASVSTTGRGHPLPTEPSRQRRQRRSRQHSVDRQVPADLAAPQRLSTSNDVSGSRTVVSSHGLTSTAPAMTNHRVVAVVPRQSNAPAAVEAVKPVTSDADGQTPSEPIKPPRHRHFVAQIQSLQSYAPDVPSPAKVHDGRTSTSVETESHTQSPSLTARMRQKSTDDTGSSKPIAGESVDARRESAAAPNTAQARRLRRRGQEGSTPSTDDARDNDRRPTSSEDGGNLPVSRRLTMPSVVHYNVKYPPTPPVPRHRQPPTRSPPERPASAVYVLSDGVRRRLVPADTGQPAPLRSEVPDIQPSTELVELAAPPRRYGLEPAAARQSGGSMVNMASGGHQAAVWRREDVSVLSEQRRDEIRRQKERDQQQTLVMRFGDIMVTKLFSIYRHLI